MITVGSLFTGYGGLDMATNLIWDTKLEWYAEIMPPACRILAHHHPNTPNLGDVTKIDWNNTPKVDIITGGFPCQDVSQAGRRLGLTQETRTGLWNNMAHAIQQLKPRLVIAENVKGILSADTETPSSMEHCPWCMAGTSQSTMRALGAVLGDLADIRYDAKWATLPASGSGAPHRRERVFIIAWPAGQPPHKNGWKQKPIPNTYTPQKPGTTLLATPTVSDASGGGAQHPDKRRAGGHTVKNKDQLVKGNRDDYMPAIRHWETITRPAPPRRSQAEAETNK